MTEPRQLHLFKGKRQKGSLAPKASEFELHCAVADSLRIGGVDGWLWSHFPAGELRSKATAGRLKRMGVKAGFFDLLLIDPDGHHYWLELKADGGRLSEAQADFSLTMQARRVPCEVARSFDEAISILSGWGAIRVRIGA
jgi:hypothetical protein